MRHLLFLLFFLPVFAKAQKPFISLMAGVDNSKELRMGLNAQIGAGFRVAGPIHLGAGVGVTNFPGASGTFIPVSAKVDFIFDEVKGFVPVLFVEPGYIVNKIPAGTHEAAGEAGIAAGRFAYQTGLGFKLPNKGKGTSFLTIGYSSYSFRNYAGETGALNSIKTYEALSVRVGFILD